MQKVSCAEFILVGVVGHWWKSTSRSKTKAQQCNITWAQLKEDVMTKYLVFALAHEEAKEDSKVMTGIYQYMNYLHMLL